MGRFGFGWLMAVAALALAIGNAKANCTTSLKLTGWDFKASNGRFGNAEVCLGVGIRNQTGRDIKMINGDVTFRDPVGNYLGHAEFKPDVSIKDNSDGMFLGHGGGSIGEDANQIVTIDHELVRIEIHIRSIMFADGEVSNDVILSPLSDYEKKQQLAGQVGVQ
jgi:hypothetical protein